jgi:hypothetical protein
MNSAFIIVGGEFDQDLTQVGLSEHDQVVDALPPDRAEGGSTHSQGQIRCERKFGQPVVIPLPPHALQLC